MNERSLVPFIASEQRTAFTRGVQANNARQAQWPSSSSAVLQGNIADRLRRASDDHEHSLLYVRFEGLEADQVSIPHRAIEQMSKRLWGRVLLVPLRAAEVVLFLEDWSGFRSLQLRLLLQLAVRVTRLRQERLRAPAQWTLTATLRSPDHGDAKAAAAQ